VKGREGYGHVMMLVGGIIPEGERAGLREIGVDGVFAVGTLTGEMVDFIRENVKS